MKELEMKFVFLCGLALALNSSFADEVAAGRAKADQACALCHGPQGIASLPSAPNLAGQPAIYVSEQLKNYRSGKRLNEVMSLIAKPLTDTDIAQVAAWYSAIKVTVELP
jgi:cytochrome c553